MPATPKTPTPKAVIPVPYTFIAGTVIDPDQVNTNFQSLGTNAVPETGGTLISPTITGGTIASAAITGGTIAGLTSLAVTGPSTFAGMVASTRGAAAPPYTDPSWKLYDDGGNWAHLAYGQDVCLRIIFGKTGQGGTLRFGASAANNGTGAFTQAGVLTEAGALTLAGGLNATTGAFSGAVTVGGTLGVTGVTTLGALTVNGVTTLAGGGISGNLSVSGTITAGSTLTVTNGGASITGTLVVNAVTVNAGNLTVSAGAVTASGNVSANANMHTGGYVYPGRNDAPGTMQSSWYLGSHGSYGLYTNTGLYVEGTVWSGAIQTRAGGTSLADLTVGGNAYFNSIDSANYLEARAHVRAAAGLYAGSYVYTAQGVLEFGRGVIAGGWIDCPLNVTTPTGTITVNTNYAYRYMLVGKSITFTFHLAITLSASPTVLLFHIPFTLSHYASTTFMVQNEVGSMQSGPGQTYFSLYRDMNAATTWSPGAKTIGGSITCQIN